nr:GTP-binding protein [Clostridia bacterium]
MSIPVYVVTGFLGAGKTSFINHLFEQEPWRNASLLFLQFETGEASFRGLDPACQRLSFSKRSLDLQADAIPQQIRDCVQGMARKPDEIWVEWNGMTPFSKLQAIFLHSALRGLCALRKVIHLADGGNPMLGKTGNALAEQIASSDVALVRGAPSPDAFRKIRRQFAALNPGLDVRAVDAYGDLPRSLLQCKEYPMLRFAAAGLALVLLFFGAKPLLELSGIPVNTVLNVFLGILLQAVPYLLIGILLSSAIQLLVPQEWIERRF